MIESTLFPIVSKINEYLSSYILIFLLVGVGLWYSIRTRFVQVRCFGEGMRKFFGELNLRGGAQKSGMTNLSFKSLSTLTLITSSFTTFVATNFNSLFICYYTKPYHIVY